MNEKNFSRLSKTETKKPIINSKPKYFAKTPDKKNLKNGVEKSPKTLNKSVSIEKKRNSEIVSAKFQKTLSRFEVYNQVKQKNLQDMKLKKHSEELSNTSSCSFISKKSNKILEKKAYKPPSKKTVEVLDHKRKSISIIQQKMEKEKSIKNPTPSFHPQLLTKQSTNQPSQSRSKNEFYQDMIHWLKKKKENSILKELEIRNQESKNLTFKPEINYLSNEIANDMSRGKSVEERLNQWQQNINEKKEKMIQNTVPNFTPKISENAESLAENYRERIKLKKEMEEEQESENNYLGNDHILIPMDSSPQKKNHSVSFNLENNEEEDLIKQPNNIRLAKNPEFLSEINDVQLL